MIYLLNTIEPQAVAVPRNSASIDGELTFRAKSTIDLDVVVDAGVTDLQISDLYINMAVTLPDGFPNGEYEYTLTDGVEILSTGLMIVGDNFRPSEYNKEITYEQYETE